MKTKEQVSRNKLKLTCCNAHKMCKKILMVVTVKCMLISILMIYVAILMKLNNLAIALIDSYFFVKNLFSLTFFPIMNGIFLFCISIMGLVGAIKHHRLMLLIYSVVLFFIFVFQLAWSWTAMSFPFDEMPTMIKTAWDAAKKNNPEVLVKIQRSVNCFGVGVYDNFTIYDHWRKSVYYHPTVEDYEWYQNRTVTVSVFMEEDSYTCFFVLYNDFEKVLVRLGGLGFISSFFDVMGVFIACVLYRSLKDPYPYYLVPI